MPVLALKSGQHKTKERRRRELALNPINPVSKLSELLPASLKRPATAHDKRRVDLERNHPLDLVRGPSMSGHLQTTQSLPGTTP